MDNKKRQQFFAALKSHNIQEEGRKSIIASFTNQRTDSLKEVADPELEAMIAYLNGMGQTNEQPHRAARPKTDENPRMDKMRKAIIRYFCLMGYLTKGGKPDMNRIQSWAVKYGAAHKKLNDLKYLDLVDLVTQVEAVYRKHLAEIKTSTWRQLGEVAYVRRL